MASNFNATYQEYDEKLESLRNQCSDAEKNVIIAETNLKSLDESLKKTIKECEDFTKMTIDQVPEMLEGKKRELDEIMSKLSGIDVEGEITEETLAKIQAITAEYNIIKQQEG